MRLRHSNASPIAKTAVVLAVLVSVIGIAVGVATQTGGAVTKSRLPETAVAVAPTTPGAAVDGAATSSAGTTSTTGKAIVAAAAKELGKPYCYGGGGINGPGRETNISSEPGCAPPKVGFDCMSLAQYAVYQGTGHTVVLPNNGARPTVGTFIKPHATEASDLTSLLPGDVVFFGGTIGNYHHSGIYAGSGKVWDALDNNIPVQEHPFSKVYSDYGNVFDGAYRYTTQTAAPLSITTKSLPGGTVYAASHRSYSATLHAAGGHPPYMWSLAAGSKPLPPGLELHSNGVISGKATKAGDFAFRVEVVDTKTTGSPKETAARSLGIRIS